MDDFGIEVWTVPLCHSDLVEGVLAVRGEPGLMLILVDLFQLRPTAKLCVYEPAENEIVYSLSMDAVDRYQNAKVGMLDARECVAFTSHACLTAEVQGWTLADLQVVTSHKGALALVRLGLITAENVELCSPACRDAFFASDLGL